ncbi:MAG: hypothetical protein K0Q90_413 [Paenibacillaceae bacterium]|jgi:uncharacterized membrane-anchored protein|nr:hypothetical protein [Paenibacillaceae bacterium]
MKGQVQLGYTLGISLLVSAAVYFYASNWGALSRWEKLIPLIGALICMYALSDFFARRPGRAFLSRLFLLASCLFFGVGLALVGQIYNSHADSYGLFAIWLIPALLLAALTRWQPFYVLSYILAHLAYLLYFFPGFHTGQTAEGRILVILLVPAIANLVLLVLAERRRFASPVLKAMSFTAVCFILLVVSNSFFLETYGKWMNLPFFLLLALAVAYYHRIRHKTYLLFSGLWISVVAIEKYVELFIHFVDESLVYWSMLFVVLFIWGNVRFLKFVRSSPPAASPESTADEAEAVSAHNAYVAWAARVLAAVVIAIATVLGTAVIMGFLVLILEVEHPEYAMGILGVLAVTAAIAARPLNSVVRYTLLTCGMVVGTSAGIILDSLPVLLLFLLSAAAAFVFITGTVQRIYCLAAGQVIAGITLDWLFTGDTAVPIFSILGAILLVLLVAAGWFIQQPSLRKPLLYGGYPSFLLVFYILTFVTEGAVYYLVNGLFFLAVTLAVFYGLRKSLTWVYAISLGFWIAFLVYKYYDLAWKLLHKSFSLALIGFILLGLTRLYERKQSSASGLPALRSRQKRFTVWVLTGIVLLQVGMMTVQISRSEWLLANGRAIKLELAPVDPRSLLQGDYVVLSYTISRPEWGEAKLKELEEGAKVTLVLAPDAEDVYQLDRIYEAGGLLKEEEVLIRGKWDGYRSFEYGIEHYFIPEGTGIDLERQARYAEVKVSAKGDAILVRLTGE